MPPVRPVRPPPIHRSRELVNDHFSLTTAGCKKVETLVSSRADLSKPRKQVPARPAAALWRAASPGAGGTGRSAARQAPGERRPSVAARSRCAHVA